MKPLRIVLAMIEPPVPFGNAAARGYYVLVRELVARGHRVTAFAACSKASEMEEARRLFPDAEYDLRLYPFPVRSGLRSKINTVRRPFSYVFSETMIRDLHEELDRGFDVLHLEQLWSGWLAERYAKRAVLKIHYLFSIDLSAVPPRSVQDWLTRRLMLRGERRLLRAYPHVGTFSERLNEGVRAISPQANVHLMPASLDASLYPYIPDDRRTAEPVIGLIGSMNWHPSHSAAVRLLSRLWPEIRRRVPNAQVQVVGWGAREALKAHLNLEGVSIFENVADTRPYFERTGVMLYAPGRGSGIKVKVQEAFAYGIPVVTTTEGIEGLPVCDGEHAGVADDDAGLIERAVNLLTDPAAQNRQRSAARSLVETACGPRGTVDAVERIYASIVSPR
jgi:glycosyltransferase involved in cell wall biosynthesis